MDFSMELKILFLLIWKWFFLFIISLFFLNYRNAGKPHVGLQEGNHNIPQIEEIENIQNNRGNVIKLQISNIRNNQNNQNSINKKVIDINLD